MPTKELTIKEVKEKKIEVEQEILNTIKSFEEESGVRISYVNINRKSYKDTAEVVEERRGPIQNVTLNMELDLIY